jgi:hypothetical protein
MNTYALQIFRLTSVLVHGIILAHPGGFFGAYPIITGFACYVKRKNCRKAKKKAGDFSPALLTKPKA